MKRYLLLIAFIASITSVYAQTSLKGKVIAADSKTPLAGASIVFGKGGTTTDKDGNFTIDCSKVGRITISFVGYDSYSQTIKSCDEELSISLTPSGRTLDEVEFTATSVENKSILYQPASITKLNKTELKRGNGLFLDDAVNANIPGMTMNRRTVSAGQQFNIRGYGNGVRGTNGVSSNFDGQGYKVYLNGIPVTDAEGITLMDDIDFASIGSMEALKGPAGTLYGQAIAGVVNLKTIRAEKGKTSIGQDAMIGSYGLQRFTTHFQTGGKNSSLLFNYGYQHSDGFMTHSRSEKRFINFSGDFDLSEKQSLTFYGGYTNSYDERGGELTIAQYNAFDYSGNPEYIKRNAHSHVNSFRLGVGHTYAFNSNISNTTTIFGTGYTSNVSSAAGWTDKDPINYGLRSTFDTKFNVGNGTSLSGITGVEVQRQHAQTIGYFMKADPANPTGYYRIDTMRSNQYTLSATESFFTEWTLNFPKDLSVTAGIGWSSLKIKLNDRFVRPNITRPLEYKQEYNDMLSPHIAINKVFSKELSLYASYSQGYKAPVSSYFFVPVSPSVGFVDSTLKPEQGVQFEIGSKGVIFNNKLAYQVAVFQTKFKDKMTAIAVPLNPPAVGTAYSYVANGGDQNDKGVEVLLKYTAYESQTGFIRMIRPFGNFTYSDFKYENYKIERLKSPATADTIIDYSGKDVAGVAPIVANIGVDLFVAGGVYANVVYSYKDPMPITSDNLFMTTSYSLLNAKLGIQRSLSRHFDIDAYVGANNITGTQYPYMVFVNQLPDAYLPAPYKINYFGGVNLKYNF